MDGEILKEEIEEEREEIEKMKESFDDNIEREMEDELKIIKREGGLVREGYN